MGLVVVTLLMSLLTWSCGSTLAFGQLRDAEQALNASMLAGAEFTATYEYFCAKEYLSKARREVTEGDYADALDLSQIAKKYATEAHVRAAHLERKQ